MLYLCSFTYRSAGLCNIQCFTQVFESLDNAAFARAQAV